MSFTEFYLARILEDDERWIASRRAVLTDSVDARYRQAAADAYDRTLEAAVATLVMHLRQVAWAVALTPVFRWVGFERVAREKATAYAWHPDYQADWRPRR